MKYEHKGVAIDFNEKAALFTAKVGIKNLKAPSLDAIRKKIDTAREVEIKPFKVIRPYPYIDQIEEGTVISVDRCRGGSRYATRDYEFRIQEGSSTRTEYNVIPDSKENRKMVQEYLTLCAEAKRVQAEWEKRVQKARDALPYVKADDVASGEVVVTS